MPMYNLLENIDSYSITSESFLNCYRDEVNDDPNENNDYYYRKIMERQQKVNLLSMRQN